MTLSLNLLIFLKIGLEALSVLLIDKFKNDIEVKKNVKNIIRILIMGKQEVNAR